MSERETFRELPEQTQHLLELDWQLTERYRPASLDAFLGLEKVKQFYRALAAHPRPMAVLHVGPPGVGKTAIAETFAAMMGAQRPFDLLEFTAADCDKQAMAQVKHVCQYAPFAARYRVIIINEADAMTEAAYMDLMGLLDHVPPRSIIIFTCNDTGTLERRFLSRCHVLEFSNYGMQPILTGFLARVWTENGGNGNAPDFARIAKDTNGNVRDALMKLETLCLERL